MADQDIRALLNNAQNTALERDDYMNVQNLRTILLQRCWTIDNLTPIAYLDDNHVPPNPQRYAWHHQERRWHIWVTNERQNIENLFEQGYQTPDAVFTRLNQRFVINLGSIWDYGENLLEAGFQYTYCINDMEEINQGEVVLEERTNYKIIGCKHPRHKFERIRMACQEYVTLVENAFGGENITVEGIPVLGVFQPNEGILGRFITE